MDENEPVRAKTSSTKPASPPPAPRQVVAPDVNQTAEKQQAREVIDSPAPLAPAMLTTSLLFERFHPMAFLFSGIGFILTFIALAVGLAFALHLPYFLATGWPDPDLPVSLQNSLGSNWPQMLLDMGRIAFIILMLPATVCVSLGRRHLGARHLIRGIIGLVGLLAAVLSLADGMYWTFRRGSVANFEEFGSVLERVLKGLQSEGAFFAAIIFVVSVIILSWPARPKKMMLTPALNQGVS
jgi:hypothetical protein